MTVAHDFTVGVGGQARSGKDTLGRYLVRRLNEVGDLGGWERRGLADPVKRIFMDVSDVNEAFVESWKTRTEPPPGFQLPIRVCLTLIGDGFRHMWQTQYFQL